MTWILAFTGFAALIVLHELGHFLAAKAVGMRVERFMLFFPPVVWSIKRGETEYGIGSIPLGGYVKITGMTPREEIPEDVAYRAYHRQAPWKRIVVILAGPMMNVLIAFVILFGLYAANGATTTVVSVVDKKAPATAVLRPGDRLVAVDGVHGDPLRLRAQIGRHTCAGKVANGCLAATPATLTIVRDGRTLTVKARPRYSAADKRPLLGFGFGAGPEPADLAVRDAVHEMWTVTHKTVSSVTKLFYSAKARKQVSGVVGSYETTRQAIGLSAETAFFILAIISLSLAIINLFPFLPLDGGHVFWALAEKVRGRPIPFSVMERASVVGFVLVAFLFVIGLSNDIGRLSGDGFRIR
jgi:regulator of sigma E protease